MKFLKRSRTRILLFLAVVGPGFITANVDNDAGGILTYSQAGAQFGHLLLWTMIPITLALIVVQEMSARMGVVTGKGLSDLTLTLPAASPVCSRARPSFSTPLANWGAWWLVRGIARTWCSRPVTVRA